MLNNKAAVMRIMEKMGPRNMISFMLARKNLKYTGEQLLAKMKDEHMRKVTNLKKDVRSFVKNVQANHEYRKSKRAKVRKIALVQRAHNLGIYSRLIPMPRGGYLGINSKAPNYINRQLAGNLSIITPSGYYKKYKK